MLCIFKWTSNHVQKHFGRWSSSHRVGKSFVRRILWFANLIVSSVLSSKKEGSGFIQSNYALIREAVNLQLNWANPNRNKKPIREKYTVGTLPVYTYRTNWCLPWRSDGQETVWIWSFWIFWLFSIFFLQGHVDLENIPLRKDALRFLEPAIEVFSVIFLT